MITVRRNCNNIPPTRYIALTAFIIADGNDRAVRLQADSMIIAYRNCHNIRPTGYIASAEVISADNNDRAVRLQTISIQSVC